VYIRVSTLDQGERYSLPSQLKRLNAMAERFGKTIPPEWVFLDKHTGKTESRPDFDKLKALVRTGAPDDVYIFDVSRFARKAMDALWLAAEFKRHGVRLDFAEMPYEDTATGRFTFGQMAVVAEFLGEKIIEDSKRGQREKLEQGKLTHGSAPYGYVYIDKRKGKDGSCFEIDTAMSSVQGITRADVVRMIYGWRRAGMASYRISQELNARGILSPGNDRAEPGCWYPRVIRRMLTNPTYVGEHLRSGIVVPCPAIIAPPLWKAVQRVNQTTRERTTGRPSHQYLLTGLVFCGKCAHRVRVTGHGQTLGRRTRPYYGCGNITYRPYQRNCDTREVPVDRLEAVVWSAIWELLSDPAKLLSEARAFYDAQERDRKRGPRLEAQRDRLRAKRDRIVRMVEDGLKDYDKGRAAIQSLDREIAAVEERVATEVIQMPSLHAAEAAVREIAAGEEPETFQERRDILERLLDLRITILNGQMTIEGKIPVGDAVSANGTGSHREKSDSGVSADPERECEDRHRGEALRAH
jgi:DNA invertase Pin-like site-specific DNA recombinase